MVQGALFVPGFARAHCHGDGTPIRLGASGTKAAEDVPPGLSRYRYIAADLQAPNFGSKREPGADLPRMQGLCTAVPGQPGHADPSPGHGGQLDGASVGAARKVST